MRLLQVQGYLSDHTRPPFVAIYIENIGLEGHLLFLFVHPRSPYASYCAFGTEEKKSKNMPILIGRPLDLAITATAGSGFLLFGYDQGVMSGLLTGDAFTARFPEIDTTDKGNGSSSLQGTVVAIYEIGCFFGAILCLLVGERLGRRKSILYGCVILSIGAALQASAYGIPQLIVGRIVAGLGNGMNTSTIRKLSLQIIARKPASETDTLQAVWHSELMKAKNRGKGLAIELAINIFGVMLSYWVDYGMSHVNNDSQFRFPLALQILFAVLTFIGILVLPESPRWLIAHDRHDEARQIIWATSKNAKTLPVSDESINKDMAEIQKAIKEEQEAAQTGSFKAMLKNGEQKFFYRTLLGIGGQFMQQISGINLITYVSSSLLFLSPVSCLGQGTERAAARIETPLIDD